MGKYNFSALRIRKTALAQKSSGKTQKSPTWMDIMSEVPPAAALIRNQAPWYSADQQKRKHIFQPAKIIYEEDELRKEFFREHPWELARPRVILENKGRDFVHYDWSKMRQNGKKLDGESVIQRELYLLKNYPDMTKSKAYDIARREFYQLRLEEDVERRVAQEEAAAVGAYFGLGMNAIGMNLENMSYDKWKMWSEKESQLQESRVAAFAGDNNQLVGSHGDASEEAEQAV